MERFATDGWNYPITLRRGQHCITSSLKFSVAKIVDITVIRLIDLATVSTVTKEPIRTLSAIAYISKQQRKNIYTHASLSLYVCGLL